MWSSKRAQFGSGHFLCDLSLKWTVWKDVVEKDVFLRPAWPRRSVSHSLSGLLGGSFMTKDDTVFFIVHVAKGKKKRKEKRRK